MSSPGSDKTKLDQLRESLTHQIAHFEQESKRHRRMYRGFRYTVFSLTASATVLAAAALSYTNLQTALNLAVVVVSAFAGLVTSIEGLRKPAELWIHERNVYHALKDLQEELEFSTAAPPETDAGGYFARMQEILAASQEKWTHKVKPSQQAGA